MFHLLKKFAESKGIRTDKGWEGIWEDIWRKMTGMGSLAVLIRGSTGALCVMVIGACLVFFSQLVLARALGIQGYGIFIYVFTWVRILSLVCRLGFSDSLVRYVSEYRVKEKWSLLKGITRFSFQLSALAGGLVGLVIFLGAICWPNLFGDNYVSVFVAGAFGLPFLTLLGTQRGILCGLRRNVLSVLPERVLWPGMLLVIALFLVFKSKGGTGLPVWAMGLNSLAMGIVFGIGLFFIRVTMPKAVWVVPQPSYEPSIWLRVSLPLLLLTGMHMLMEHIGVILVGSLAGSQGAGLLAAAERVSHFVIFGLVASNTILAPMISEFYHKQKWKKLQRILTITARGVFFFTLFFAILLIIFGPWVMNLFGEGFGKAYVPLIIIVIGQMVSSCSGPAGETMVMTGHQDQAALIMGGAVAITVLLSLALVPIYNATGGAIALCAGTGFWNVSMVVYLRRKINLNTTILNF